MFTVFHPEFAEMVRELHGQHVDFRHGKWDDDGMDRHQLERFRATLAYVRERSPFYRERLEFVDPARIDSLSPEALADVPFTTKDDLRIAQFDMLSRPMSDAWIFYETTGTTGASTPCPRDNVDSLHNNTALTVHYETIFRQFGGSQVIGVSGPSELHATGDTFGDVCRNLGLAVAKMWPHSPMIGFERAFEVMRMLPITGLFCTPGMAMTLAKKAVAAGLDPVGDFSLDVLMLTGELASPSLLDNIGRTWGAKAYNALYASQEASVLAAAGADGGLYTAPVINHYEVVDPTTLQPAPADTDGVRQGELVVTNLYQGAKPLVRYRTGDMVRMFPGDATATLPSPRVEILGRVRDRLVLNGVPVTGYDLENLLLRHVRDYLDYQVVIERTGDRDSITLILQGEFALDDPALARTVEDCRTELGVDVRVAFGDPGSITSTGAMVSWKAARVVDRRDDSTPELEAALALAERRGE